MDLLIIILQGLALIGILFLAMFKKNYFPKYLEKKAENTATKEDIRDITSKIESVKQEYKIEFDEIQQKNEVFFDEIRQSKNRFNAKQFELYNELWNSLVDLKFSANELWESANKTKLQDFSKKVYNAKVTIEKTSLLIDNNHYDELLRIIQQFDNFKFGKGELIGLKSLRRKTKNEMNGIQLYDQSIEEIINQNRQIKYNYDALLDKIKIKFVEKIRGNET